ncbi:aminomethyl-transferring glycine dehydrogenase subunit GcvPA [Clostridium sp. CS001]|uniref:aminomethyl-transferring glycine dehydrogenase subunit GcvPA n=1 Tax=Clostridium sp. CS001 TaxID=2880648 RepID=UPI001CF0FA0A|nr:aminomethyl-transferring glycine dehydrogenase subunit GcvPA [Clostridium sp. CS001]MCB2290116.1 aminomethyl-transferring glycine dehydrogenase subunit GcvPA [Clostridium sp. CS001]
MFPYIPVTEKEKNEMLNFVSAKSIDDLFKDIPDNLKLNRDLNIPMGLSELEVEKIMTNLSEKNKSTNDLTCFLGAGAYDHYVPSIVKHLIGRTEFYTAYTPYQPEISQGTLQAVFEYQTMICSLTGMAVSNSSMYDGATATAEACVMAIENTKRNTIVVSKTVNPDTRDVLRTYMKYKGYNLVEIDESNGATDIEKVKSSLGKDVAAVIIQSPNFFGIIEETEELEKIIHENKSLFIMNVDPLSLGVLKSPGELGADIAVGDAQWFGGNLNFGGPGLGFLNTTTKLMRKIPGRVVGETDDGHGNKGYVLTLQAREQHIRRDKATSNICSDQTLLAIAAAVYMSTVGKEGIREIGLQCIKKSHYAYNKLIASGKYKPVFDKPFFKEFAVTSASPVEDLNKKLFENNILGGYVLEKEYPEHKDSMLFCVTEKRTKEDIDKLVKVMEEI